MGAAKAPQQCQLGFVMRQEIFHRQLPLFMTGHAAIKAVILS